jgi:pyrroline-5-carboxylate reductase
MNIRTLSVGFLGAGRMATALARGFCTAKIGPQRVLAVDPYESARCNFSDCVGKLATAGANPDLLSDADLIFLAVKPQVMTDAIASITNVTRPNQLIVSIAAGIPIAQLESGFSSGTRIIRVMPNTPCLVGEGACGLSAGSHATDEDVQVVVALLESVGVVEQIPEKLMDALTGLSGSGPAYAFQMIEALSDGGVKMGLPRVTSTRLAAQTLLGAAKMILETGEHPGTLKDAVTSPGGTTIAGIHAMEAAGVRAALMNAVQASAERSAELG